LANWATLCQKQGEPAAARAKGSLNHFRDWLAGCFAVGIEGADIWIIAMPLHLERIDWMPSPPLAPDDGPIDIEHLGRMTLGDVGLEREVLAMFSAQAVHLAGVLAALPPDAAALAHTLKGSARAIGAFQVAEAAEGLEAAIRNGDDACEALADLEHTIKQARTAIDVILHRA
jgi:HPt (histidine-containing phosphotransfer) domain-containing protein